MGDSIELRVDGPDDLSATDVREALSALTDDDVSETSPVSAGAPEAGTAVNDDGSVTVAVAGHLGSFTKTTEDALVSALGGVHPEASVSVEAGGYDSS